MGDTYGHPLVLRHSTIHNYLYNTLNITLRFFLSHSSPLAQLPPLFWLGPFICSFYILSQILSNSGCQRAHPLHTRSHTHPAGMVGAFHHDILDLGYLRWKTLPPSSSPILFHPDLLSHHYLFAYDYRLDTLICLLSPFSLERDNNNNNNNNDTTYLLVHWWYRRSRTFMSCPSSPGRTPSNPPDPYVRDRHGRRLCYYCRLVGVVH
ncbi:hypothetical protein BD779DRAFT_705683 [Infundibulicybe gibba]|nr:hypothetical protein BD779DRAFT_705683 [Infundibulicybe gibba]